MIPNMLDPRYNADPNLDDNLDPEALKRLLLPSLGQFQPEAMGKPSIPNEVQGTPGPLMNTGQEPSAIDDYRKLISSMPQPEKPGLGRSILGTVAGALGGFSEGPTAGVKLGQSILQGDYPNQLDAWKRQVSASQPALMFDRVNGQNDSRRYAADRGLEGKKYGADVGLRGKKYAADKGLEGKILAQQSEIAKINRLIANEKEASRRFTLTEDRKRKELELNRMLKEAQAGTANARTDLLDGPVTDRVNAQAQGARDRHNDPAVQLRAEGDLMQQFANNPVINSSGNARPGADPALVSQEQDKFLQARNRLMQQYLMEDDQ